MGRGAPMPEIDPAINWPNYREADFVIQDYRFASGEVLPELRLHCRTMGTPRRDPTGKIVNGVLLLQGNTGTGANWLRPSLADELYGPGQPLDAAQSFLHHAGCDRTRRVVEACRRAAREFPALPLPRHGRERLPAHNGAPRRRPSAARHWQLDGRHARLDVGGDVSRFDGRAHRAVVPAARAQRPQLARPPPRRRSDPQQAA